jgi:hypothetical protein
VRPVFGNTALKPRAAELPEENEADIRFFRAIGNNARARQRQRNEVG